MKIGKSHSPMPEALAFYDGFLTTRAALVIGNVDGQETDPFFAIKLCIAKFKKQSGS